MFFGGRSYFIAHGIGLRMKSPLGFCLGLQCLISCDWQWTLGRIVWFIPSLAVVGGKAGRKPCGDGQ